MPVYVDKPVWRFGRMRMCHMIADTLPELHAMAERIGVARRHFQHGDKFPHYDICKEKRDQASKYGARDVTWRELVQIMRRFRDHHPNWRTM